MSNNNVRKTQRKNKTKQTIIWPSLDDYFTIDNLILTNQHMLTETGSDITLRVKLMKSVKGDGVPKTVATIGTINTGKGRPQLVFAMMPVKAEVLEKAKQNKIMLVEETTLVPVVNVAKQTSFRFPKESPKVDSIKVENTNLSVAV